MDLRDKSLRIIFRDILKSLGFECRSADNYVYSYAYAYQPLFCIKYAGPFFLRRSNARVEMVCNAHKTIYINATNCNYKPMWMCRINEITTSGNVPYFRPARCPVSHCYTSHVSYYFDISDPNLITNISDKISELIEYYKIYTVPNYSKIQLPNNGPARSRYYWVIESDLIHNKKWGNFGSTYPNVVYIPTDNRGWLRKKLSELYRWIFNATPNELVVNSIMRHTGCAREKAELIVKEAASMHELRKYYDDFDNDTSLIVSDYKSC